MFDRHGPGYTSLRRRISVCNRRALACATLLTMVVTSSTLHSQQALAGAQKPAVRALVDIYDLNMEGRETPLSLVGLDWTPSSDSMVLGSASADISWFPLLPLSEDGELVQQASSIALGTVTGTGTRRAALGSNPVHDFVRPRQTDGHANAHTEIWLEQLVAWLLDSDMPFAPLDAPQIKVVLAHVSGPSGDREDDTTRQWFESRGHHVAVSAPYACDGPLLDRCLEDADLLVLGPGHASSPADGYSSNQAAHNTVAIERAIMRADQNAVPVLYLHKGAVNSPLATAALEQLSLVAEKKRPEWVVARAGGAQLHQLAPILAAARP